MQTQYKSSCNRINSFLSGWDLIRSWATIAMSLCLYCDITDVAKDVLRYLLTMDISWDYQQKLLLHVSVCKQNSWRSLTWPILDTDLQWVLSVSSLWRLPQGWGLCEGDRWGFVRNSQWQSILTIPSYFELLYEQTQIGLSQLVW